MKYYILSVTHKPASYLYWLTVVQVNYIFVKNRILLQLSLRFKIMIESSIFYFIDCQLFRSVHASVKDILYS